MTQNTVQSTYGTTMPIGSAGAAATTHGWDADTKQAEGNIGFGLAVSKGEADDGVLLGGSLFVGVSMKDITISHDTADRYEAGDNVAVMTRGDIWVVVEDAVVAQTAITYNTTTGALGSSGGTAISGAIWKTSADAGGFAIARLSGANDVTT
jgi:hypothetical protein